MYYAQLTPHILVIIIRYVLNEVNSTIFAYEENIL